MIYILRSSAPIGSPLHSASVYIGYADDDKFMARINKHTRGKGSHFTRACIAQGNTLMLMALIEGSRDDERALKNRCNAARLIDQLQRGIKPKNIKGNVLFVQPKNWRDTCPETLPIFSFSTITL